MARRIGQILVDLGFLTDEQLEIVLEEQEQTARRAAWQDCRGNGADH